ncbi:HNH endonuclease signature motif containing protein [Mycobacterium nebraskense]|uniref:HNH nuclease domain-containing protein n=1 Tax=Mycobacterium nebraskense TaxID=244292 RepID=A0A1X2A0B6_9MYCO|nr:HNH endonuclease signature motif containing protein [Mycobacterium nebraskense]KKC01969.1 hypothetical protein WU83_26625 [Mycobacterium nebraskense]MBI2693523.1 HNH endonuclease [Mycobacterium nebraskense]MCV7117373.1 HNH endonuclease [Mycobacterium nebraskense]ORW33643.1 hypothetical protein AWC17_24895 [Mycobacterium nebraskense]
MRSSTREEIAADYAALREVVSRIGGHSYDGLTTPERFTYLESLEREMRRLPVAGHELINQIECQATPSELGGKLAHVLADRLRITRGEASRRIKDARALGTRQTLTGEPLAPRYAAAAAAQRAGRIGASHIAAIHHFFDELPCWVDAPTRDAAEADLARWASEQRPEGLRKAADRLTCYLNPDGKFNDEDRARHRGLTLGTQDSDGMSPVRGWLTPEARATWEAVFAKLAAPGMCNPDDDAPVVDGAPPEEAVQRDTRTAPQRNHDGLNAALRAMLASGNLGQHNGLPAAIVVTTTLNDLEAAAGKGLTGGGTLLPMSDVIRLARHAHHYLAIFDKGKPLALYHTKRLASRGQRIVLYAKDRGCSAPGCDVPGYYCEVHHVQDWATTHQTDIDQLTLACGTHHRLLDKGWSTRRRADGDIEWIPPPHLDYGQPRTNTFHHPEKLMSDGDEDDP